MERKLFRLVEAFGGLDSGRKIISSIEVFIDAKLALMLGGGGYGHNTQCRCLYCAIYILHSFIFRNDFIVTSA